MTTQISLSTAYDFHLGGVIAISPESYGKALDSIAKMMGRINDETFQAEVRAYEKKLPCYLD